jgi:ubiquitin carboxyl-terminal hydrolase L5
VFTGLLRELGVKGLDVKELWGLDMLSDIKCAPYPPLNESRSGSSEEDSPVHALVFLFKWVGQSDTVKPDGVLETPEVPHYFA